jgi:hypothetical protein
MNALAAAHDAAVQMIDVYCARFPARRPRPDPTM